MDYFPETAQMMTESIQLEDGSYEDGEMVIREIEYDWDNVLPLSRSDKVVDASTLRDRGAVSLSTYLEQAGFKDPEKEIKKLKKEGRDADLMTTIKQFQQFSPGVVKAQLEAQKEMQQNQDLSAEAAAAASAGTQPTATPSATPPILNQSQNDGRRGILSSTGTPTGQTATPKGAVAQTTQNLNAQNGV